MRRGYMGHLTRIANTVVHNLEKGPVHAQISNLIAGLFAVMSTTVDKTIEFHLFPVLGSMKSRCLSICLFNAAVSVLVDVELPEDCRGRWETFVDQTLSETNRKNTLDLVIVRTLLYKNPFYSSEPFWLWSFWFSFIRLVQIGTGHLRPSSDDDMESPFPKELTLQQVQSLH